MKLTERMYLRLVDLTGRQIREGKRGHISPEVTPVLEAMDIDAEAWVKNVENYGKLPDMRRDASSSIALPARSMNLSRPPKRAVG